VIVEQNLPLVCAPAHKVYALKEGKVAAKIADGESIRIEVFEGYL
jgi:ABC-type branched-subunit amino acid transport system ATPase component